MMMHCITHLNKNGCTGRNLKNQDNLQEFGLCVPPGEA